MKISLKLKAMILLGGFLCVISLIIAANFWVNRLQKDYALIINLTGRQRMLSQKMTKDILGIVREKEGKVALPDHRESLTKARELFDRTLRALISGGETTGAVGKKVTLPKASNPLVLNKLNGAYELWKEFNNKIDNVLKQDATPDSEEFKKALTFIEENNTRLLDAMNVVTEIYQGESDEIVSMLERLQFWTLLLSLAVAGGGFLAVNYIVIKPVRNMADDLNSVATGDLTVESKVKSSDEIGNMAVTVNQMTGNLRGMVKAISSTSSNVVFISEIISSTTKELNAGADIQNSAISMTSSSIDEMNASVKEIAGNTSKLSYKAEEVASTTLEMSASIDEIARIAEELSYTVDEVTSSITELTASVKEITDHASQLSTSTEETAASVSQINASIKEVEGNLKVSANLSEATSVDAEAGMEAVNKTIDGMKNIKETVDTAAAVIKRLGAKSEAIGDILHVINEVAEQTNLLALNAAIIAAQAGEHGKGFSVVADEIKGLAKRTTVSTKEIETLIKGVQSEVTNAVKSIEAGGKSVAAGMKVSNLAGNALEKILSSATSSRQMVEQISRASAEQLKGSQQASEAMEKITDMIKMVFRAIEDQEKGSAYISQAAEKMKDAATHVKKTTKEQSHNGEFISKAIEKMAEMTNSIHRATSEQANESQKIVKAILEIKEITEKNVAGVGKMREATETLVGQTSVLEDAVKKFKV